MNAVGGTEVVLWAQRTRWRDRDGVLQIWAATVDGREVLRYEDAVADHYRSPKESRLMLAILFLGATLLVYMFLILIDVMRNLPEQKS